METNITKVAFFIDTPFNLRDYERYGIGLLRENGFEVEIWDFTPALNEQLHRRVQVNEATTFHNYFLFKSKRSAIEAINNLHKQMTIIFLLGYSAATCPIYRAVSHKANLVYGFLFVNKLPDIIGDNRRSLSILYRRFVNITLYKVIDYFFSKLHFKAVGIRPANFVITAGNDTIPGGQPVDATTKRLSFHALDYDLYLDAKKKDIQGQEGKKTAVFLDEYLPFHPDFIRLGVDSYAGPEEYYPLLNKFFDYLEKTYGFQVVIASHPRSRYENHPDYFGGRLVRRGDTVKMVRGSSVVITHCSTSINFAILFEKPIIFITSDKLQKTYEGAYIDAMAKALGKKSINLNRDIDIDIGRQLMVDGNAYRRYKNAYIKNEESEDLPFWQLFVKYLRVLPDIDN